VSHRAYILLDIADGKSAEAVQSLRDRPGVVKADLLEGSPDILVICEAFNRQRLAELTVGALATVEQVTENMCLLPVQSQPGSAGTRKSSNSKVALEGAIDAYGKAHRHHG
jgi:hypothetical protein